MRIFAVRRENESNRGESSQSAERAQIIHIAKGLAQIRAHFFLKESDMIQKTTLGIMGIALGIALCGSNASAQDSEFSDLMLQGVNQYKQGLKDPKHYESAIEYFQKAYAIQKNPDVLYNIGRSYHMLNKCPEALEKYREYALVSAENAKAVKNYIADLTEQCGVIMGNVTLTCTPENATLIIDGKEQPKCGGTHELEIGVHKFSFLADGYDAQTREIGLSKSSRSVTLSVVMNKAAQTTAASSAADADGGQTVQNTVYVRDTEKTGMFWGAVGATAGGVVALLAGGSLVGTAYRQNTMFNDKKYDGLYERNSGKLAGGGVLMGLGTAAAVTGIVLFLVDAFSDRSEPTASDIQIVPSVGVSPDGGAGAWMTMTF